MKVFISWSGDRSHRVAELLSSWLSCVLQAVEPWLSSKDIDRGSLWFNELGTQLSEISIGVLCITQDNKAKPWILFEAGALAKGLPTSRVCTLLVDLELKDIENPLAQFNHTLPDRLGMRRLVSTLNKALGASELRESVLEQVFDRWWGEFEEKFEAILAETKDVPAPPPRDPKDVLSEILENTRNISSRVRKLEQTAAIEAMETASVSSVARVIQEQLVRSGLVVKEISHRGNTFVVNVDEDPPKLQMDWLREHAGKYGDKIDFRVKRGDSPPRPIE